MDRTTCQAAMTAAVQLFGSFFCLAFAAAVTVSLAAMAAAAVETAAATTAVSGSSYCFSSAAAVPASVLAAITVAANLFENGLGGIFGCPSCHENNPAMIETLKLFLPYFPLHIQNLISLYLKFLEFVHTFELIQNMMNHIDEYQALFKAFENMGNQQTSESPLAAMAPLFGNHEFPMPDFGSMQKMMEGSDLIDEFTYVEEPSGTGWYGS